MSSPANTIEVAVIGAGVIGLACARALALKGKEVVILERATSIGSGTSSRNSEVIHAGLYYPPSTLKTTLCVRGRQLLYSYCERRNVSHKKIGKVIVATTPAQYHTDIPSLVAVGKANGVSDLKILSRIDVSYLEPEVTSHGGLLSPSTGIVDSHGFMLSLLGEAEDAGTCLALDSRVVNARRDNDGIRLILNDGVNDELFCNHVVNSAGLFADRVARMIVDKGGNETGEERLPSSRTHRRPRHYYAKGNYFKLEGQPTPFSRLVYPLPSPGGLGVHATLDLNGRCRFGPDVEWINPEVIDPDDIVLDVAPERAAGFYREIRNYWPDLKDGGLVPDYAGIRPKLGHPDVTGGWGLKEDFVIEGEDEHGIPGFVNLLNMESPGLTSSLAVAEMVANMID